MARSLTAPRDPEALGLGILALRNLAAPVAAPSDFETQTLKSLKKLGVTKTVAKRILDNYDKIRPTDKTRFLGPIGVATTPPRTIRKRPTAALVADRVVIPRTILRERFGPVVTAPIPSGPAILAPIDYTVTYEGMHCIDETHYDWMGSDEIYVMTSTVHITRNGANVVRTERMPFQAGTSGTYPDVDSHETKIGPRAAAWNGVVTEVQLGMSITTVFFEHDFGDPDHFREEVDAGVKLAIAIAAYLYPPAGAILALIEASGLVTDFFNWILGTGDDEIGTNVTVLEFEDLENFSRTRKTDYREPRSSSRTTGLKYHFLGSVNDNDYVAAYTVSRNPPAPLYEPIVE